MSSRSAHRMTLLGDGDVLHAGVVAVAACVFSAGLVYVAYFAHVWRVARQAPCRPERGDCVLVFGKHAPNGRIDRDFEARLDRAVSLWQERPSRQMVLLGGGADGEPTEAEIARGALHARGYGLDAPLQLEGQSRDTLQNLRNARTLLQARAATPAPVRAGHLDSAQGDISQGAGPGPMQPVRQRVTLLSNRYHLARCALFAGQLGMDWELCAAEPRMQVGPGSLRRLAGEAAYLCLADIGMRWARLIRHRRMLARVT